jgi:heat shock transcription factor
MQSQHQDLLGAYQKAMGVNGDVEHLQDSIDSLVRSMGLDLPSGSTPSATAPPPPTAQAPAVPTSNIPNHSLAPEGTFDDPDFNVDDFLDQLARTSDVTAPEQTDV